MSRKRHTPADEPHFLVRTLAAEFADGRELPPHAHPWGQLIYAASGVMSVWTEQGSWVAPPHWAVWAPAGVAHAMRFTGAASMRTLYLRPGLGGLASDSAVVTVSPLLRELILRAVEIGMLDEREPTHVAMADLIVHELRTHSTPSLDLPLPQGEFCAASRSTWRRRRATVAVMLRSRSASVSARARSSAASPPRPDFRSGDGADKRASCMRCAVSAPARR